MTTYGKENVVKLFSLLPLTVIISGYFIVLSFSYAYGYWTLFNLDFQIILGLFSPLDLIKSLIIPFISSFVIISMIMVLVVSEHLNESRSNKLIIESHTSKVWIWIAFSIFPFIGFYCAYKSYITKDNVYLQIGMCFEFCFFIYVLFQNIIRDIFGSRYHILSFLGLVFIFQPAICFGLGHSKGLPDLNSHSLVMRDNTQCSHNPHEKFIILGIYNDKGVSFSPKSKEICIFIFNSSLISYTDSISKPLQSNLL